MHGLITPLIVCGGSGTRLWPASRQSRPKQFLPLFGPLSTFQETLLRVSDPDLFDRPVIVTNHDHRFLAANQVQEIGLEADFVLEPEARDSGPAIAAGAAFLASRRGRSAAVLSLAADHAIRNVDGFCAACRAALSGARRGYIVTFGIVPAYPATGYGYIERGDVLEGPVSLVRRFVEKPDHETAEAYLREGYLWNSGNFLFEAQTLLDEYAAQEAQTIEAVEAAVSGGTIDDSFFHLEAGAFGRAEKRSVDYALMEKTAKTAVLQATFDWSDVGSWDAVAELLPPDEAGNAAQGLGVFMQARGNVVYSDGPTVAVVGLDDLAVIATPDAILVARRSDAAGVKGLVEHIRSIRETLTRKHQRVFNRWGTLSWLEDEAGHHVVRLIVNPGMTTPPQKSVDGVKNWTVIRGVGVATVGGRTDALRPGDALSIPTGSVHQAENNGSGELEILEIGIRGEAQGDAEPRAPRGVRAGA